MNDITNNLTINNNSSNQELETSEKNNDESNRHVKQLIFALSHILTQTSFPVDNIRLTDVVHETHKSNSLDCLGDVIAVLQKLGIDDKPEVLDEPDAAFLPLLALHKQYGWGIIDQKTPHEKWNFKQQEQSHAINGNDLLETIRIGLSDQHITQRNASFIQILKQNLITYKDVIIEAVIASFVINLLALAVSLFSMQVYDRVIPTKNQNTLIILATGVGLIIVFEALMKLARSRIMDKVVVGLDQHLSREVFQRLLKVRIDQMPSSVGSLAAQLRGYEQVRSFFTASTLFILVDIPMSLIFLILISFIGSPLVAIVPIIAAIIAIVLGLTSKNSIDNIAKDSASASYQKTGLLVETVEGVETIKSGAGSWKFLKKWLDVMQITISNDLAMKHKNDNLSYFSQMLQQVSYVSMVIVGCFVIFNGDMTMGGMIACSILGGRVLAPIMSLPNLLVQASHAKAASGMIENLFALEQDNHGVSYPLAPNHIKGQFNIDEMSFNYQGNDRPAVNIKNLLVRPGERIAILGPIGSGKSTLLKILSGLYAATEGHVLLDGLDIQQINRDTLSEKIGYLQQDHRLFQGSLRDNLLIGMAAPTDDELHDCLVKSGLINLVASHSSGLDLPISEGGRGLSGGQKQLVAFTRLLLTKPSVLLLDEPTASMDNRQEQRCLHVLRHELQRGQTFIVATHKTALLDLVDRLIIMDGQKIIMDGPKDLVLQKLRENDINNRKQQEQAMAKKTENITANYQQNIQIRKSN